MAKFSGMIPQSRLTVQSVITALLKSSGTGRVSEPDKVLTMHISTNSPKKGDLVTLTFNEIPDFLEVTVDGETVEVDENPPVYSFTLETAGELKIEARKDGYQNEIEETVEIEDVFTAPVNIVLPKVTGNAIVGGTLSVDDGTWEANPPPGFAYQWFTLIDGNPLYIPAASSNTFVLTEGQKNFSVGCWVIADNSEGDTTAASEAVGPVAGVPDSFTTAQWALTDGGNTTGTSVVINVTAIPSANNSTITALQYRLNGTGAWIALTGGVTTGNRTITVPATTLASIEVRAVNAVGPGDASAAKTVTPTARNVPSAFVAANWTLANKPSTGTNTLTVNITAVPANNGAAITAIQYQLNGTGAWTALSGTGTGARDITVPAGASASVQIRAVNSVGNGAASDTKSATPTILAAPSAFAAGNWTLTNKPSSGANTVTINITALPASNGASITSIQYQLNGTGTWNNLTGTGTGARDITVPANASVSVFIRAVNSVGNGNNSDTKTATPTILAVPGAFSVGQWTLTDAVSENGDTLNINITGLPANNGATITAVQYQLNGGTWTSVGGTTTGTYPITVPALTEASVILRAVNSVGDGTASTAKTATPTSSEP